ncbi:MAG: hypothetical protein NZZ41_03830 [Candidatus Dojkabacteria bacterium]|nr:hypothetical protein [Candidatus Dojkabacteria bacterium]
MSNKPTNSIIVDGVVVAIFSGITYDVKINYHSVEHIVKCSVSGKVRKTFVDIKVGDKVSILINLEDINKGSIVSLLSNQTKK